MMDRIGSATSNRATVVVHRSLRHPNNHNYVVIARGQAYIVDPNNPKSWSYFGDSIEYAFEIKN